MEIIQVFDVIFAVVILVYKTKQFETVTDMKTFYAKVIHNLMLFINLKKYVSRRIHQINIKFYKNLILLIDQ